MPLIEHSSYHPPWYLTNGHVQTIYPILFRRRPEIAYRRERLHTPDGDFLEIDWSETGAGRLAIICHGLEGCSVGIHELCMVSALNARRWDALVLNFRGCGDSVNRTLRFYHSGETEDLDSVIRHAAKRYAEIVLIGFSLGGNVVLVYLGRDPAGVHPAVKQTVVFSVPCDLAASVRKLSTSANRFYMRRFLKSLSAKLRVKDAVLPGKLDLAGLDSIRTFEEFDDRYTAPIHGFRSARDYWEKSSSARYVASIRIPTLLVNARNDPFLAPECFPTPIARESRSLYLETPASGGHNGFILLNPQNRYWAELRTLEFLNQQKSRVFSST
jgi:predicted alpha/beta-fold hydrolase